MQLRQTSLTATQLRGEFLCCGPRPTERYPVAVIAKGLAREYYWQFLKRYDTPVEALRPMVEEAREAYRRAGGTRDLPPLSGSSE